MSGWYSQDRKWNDFQRSIRTVHWSVIGEKDDLFNSQLVWDFVLSIMCHGLLYQLQAPERLIQNIWEIFYNSLV